MGLLENLARRRHARSRDWPRIALTSVHTLEVLRAAQTSLAKDEQAYRARLICDEVIRHVGQAGLVQAFIDCDYEMRTNDKVAVTDRALEVSGFNRVRAKLFGDPS